MTHAAPRHVRYEVSEGVATITLARPERLNAFTDFMEAQLIESFDRADADDAVRAVVLTGEGRAFCAGMDLSEAPDPEHTFSAWRSSADAPPESTAIVPGQELPIRRDGGGRVALRIWSSRKPVISAINGPAVGVGVTMTLPTDLRLATEGATFCLPFVHRAFVPESCSSWFLPRLVPMHTAMEWTLTGRRISAVEARDAGLIGTLHPPGELIPAALELAGQIGSASPVSVAATRHLMWRGLATTHPMQAHQAETWALNLRGVSQDAGEGIRAFLEKRPPAFSDLVSSEFGELMTGFDEEPTYSPLHGSNQ